MATLSSHLIEKFFQDYSTREVAFTTPIVKMTGIEPKNVYLKIKGDQLSCIVYSLSMSNARVIANLEKSEFNMLKAANNQVNLRLSFFPQGSKASIVFFVPSIVEGYKNFSDKNKNTYILTLKYTKKPPDDLIEVLGKIFKEKENYEKRKDIRINLDGKVITDVGLKNSKAIVVIENIKRPCIIRNISIAGAFILLSCMPKLLLNKKVFFIIYLSKINLPIILSGTIIRSEEVQGRNDIFGIGILYDQEKIPGDYKIMINSYLDKQEELQKIDKK